MEEKIENIEKQDNVGKVEHTCTAYNAMEQGIETCSEWMDLWSMDYKDITRFNTFRNVIIGLANEGALPEVARDWIRQMIKIDNRFSKSKFIELFNSKKELTLEEYCDLEEAVNVGATGITMKELTVLTGRSEYTIREILFSECYLTVADHCPHQLLMQDHLDMYLIPIVNEKNQLTGELRIKYLFTSEAVSILAENMDDYGVLY